MFLKSLNISASGLTAQQYRLNLVAQNVTNMETTRTEAGGPYKRKTPILQSIDSSGSTESGRKTFKWHLDTAINDTQHRHTMSSTVGNVYTSADKGVRVSEVIEDPTPGKIVYNPDHPDADEDGYVEMPNVELLQEMVDAMGASRSYEANVQAFNAIKLMAQKALEIGR